MNQETIVDDRVAPTADDYRTSGSEAPEPHGGEWVAPAPVKVCRECSAQTQTQGSFCPHCGASYMRPTRKARLTRRGKVARALALVLVVAGGGTAGVIFKLDHDSKLAAKRHAAALAAQQKRDDAQRQADAKTAADKLERGSRADLVKQLEKSVTKDAQKDVNSGLLNGPVLRTECNPTGGSSLDDLSVTTGDFTCLAVNADNADGTASGYRFSATVNYDQFNYTWHLGG
ncbi:MAG: hypothetical protein QOI19_2391 [Thermoleophilaceae bacterium]|nr:hypothetical protein [Thermoleophilaceae bacterium]